MLKIKSFALLVVMDPLSGVVDDPLLLAGVPSAGPGVPEASDTIIPIPNETVELGVQVIGNDPAATLKAFHCVTCSWTPVPTCTVPSSV